MNAAPIAMRDAFLSRVWQAMLEDSDIFFACADFGSPVLDKIRLHCPNRFVNVGIAEQNLINVSAGLALEGFKVFAYAIAPFITMRCYEQIRVNLALLSEVRPMNVNLVGVGAGYSYVVSGPTHQCYEDLTIMRAMPNMGVFSPADHVTAAALFDRCVATNGPKYLRLDAQVLPVLDAGREPIAGRGLRVLRPGRELGIVATGFMVHTALMVAERLAEEGVVVGVIDLFDLSDGVASELTSALAGCEAVLTLEEGFQGRGGLDALVLGLLAKEARRPVLNIGVGGGYRFELGSRRELHELVGIGPEVVLAKARNFLATLP